jgi:hypothetical protein
MLIVLMVVLAMVPVEGMILVLVIQELVTPNLPGRNLIVLPEPAQRVKLG